MLAEVVGGDDTIIHARGAGILPALKRVDRVWRERRDAWEQNSSTNTPALPFYGGWIGFIGFECGEWIEPAVTRGPSNAQRMPSDARDTATSPPDLWLARCDAALVHDALTGEWHAVGEPTQANALHARALAVQDAITACAGVDAWPEPTAHPPLSLVPVESDAEYEADVRRAIEYVHAGDVFQVNVARRFIAEVPADLASWRAIGARALGLARYGAYLEVGGAHATDPHAAAGCAIASYSPELFLTVDGATGRIVTRPIKGTMGAVAVEAGTARTPSETSNSRAAFESNAKERAELHMIVDLMRNDLSRVCQPRTVRVASARVLEDHPTVLHGVGEVEGTLRHDASLLDILRATFPPGSVTGAPKIRAVQIIRELERAPRGPYCGAIGCLSDCGSMTWSVAIRTGVVARAMCAEGAAGEVGAEGADSATQTETPPPKRPVTTRAGGPFEFFLNEPPTRGPRGSGSAGAVHAPAAHLTYWAGCGVVAESEPAREVRESWEKVGVVGHPLPSASSSSFLASPH